MGTIKDAFDMITQIINKTKDRKTAAELLQIQSLISTVQAENNELTSKNLEVERKMFKLEKKHEKEIAELKEKFSARKLQDKYNFNETYGVYESKETKQYFCTSCLLKGIESPLRKQESGWDCQLKDCDQFYSNPSYKFPLPKTPGYGF